jgi:dihydrofolate reductase
VRRIIASEFISADGYIVGPKEDMSWVMGRFNEEMGKYVGDLMASMDTVLLGRVTYRIMAGAWPNLTEQQSPGAGRMNAARKVVLSRTLMKAPWGKYDPATIVSDAVEKRIRELKEKPGKNIVIYGSANAVQNLTQMGLIDEYQLLVHPVFLGEGKPLFKGMERALDLKLVKTQTFSNGVDVLYYRPQAQGTGAKR